MKEKYYCPICGNILDSVYLIGDICPCCGNESEFNDDILFNELDKFSIIDFSVAKVNKLEYVEYSSLGIPKDVAHHLLRTQWINKGCEWKYNHYNKRPESWNIEKAKEQLKNIKIDINNY